MTTVGESPHSALLPLADPTVVTIALNLLGPAAAARLRELGVDVVTVLPLAGDPWPT